MRVIIPIRAVTRALVLIIVVLTVLSVAEQYVIHILDRADLEEFLIAVDLDAEANIPTWFSSIILLMCAPLLALIAMRTKRAGGRFVGHWWILSGTFVVLSIDELAQLHEHLGRLHSVWNTHGLLYFAWVIPASLAVAVMGLAYLPFLAHLPPATRRRFICAGLVYVGGALGVEAISGWRAETMGMNNMTHSLIATVEEVMEMSGVVMFLNALLREIVAGGPAPHSGFKVELQVQERKSP